MSFFITRKEKIMLINGEEKALACPTVLSELLTTDDGADLEFDLLTGPTAPLSVAPATGAMPRTCAAIHSWLLPPGVAPNHRSSVPCWSWLVRKARGTWT